MSAKAKDFIGLKFGRLTVVSRGEDHLSFPASRLGKPLKLARWVCLCECGGSALVKSQDLNMGRSKSCGCLRRESRKFPGKDVGIVAHFSKYLHDAKSKGLAFKMTMEEFEKVASENCTYCGEKGESKFYYGGFRGNDIDRINHSLGYVKENICSCCKKCKSAKGDMSGEEFFSHIEKIYSFMHNRTLG